MHRNRQRPAAVSGLVVLAVVIAACGSATSPPARSTQGSTDKPGGENLLIDPTQQAIYQANYVSPGRPSPVLRKYALPAK